MLDELRIQHSIPTLHTLFLSIIYVRSKKKKKYAKNKSNLQITNTNLRLSSIHRRKFVIRYKIFIYYNSTRKHKAT